MAKPGTREDGKKGEVIALQHLKGLGMRIVETNYRFGHGEIDIVAMDGDTLVFCEVKYRTSDRFGPPEYAVTPRKQRQVRKIAEGYLYEHKIRGQLCRFDVVAIRDYAGKPELNHIRNAF